MSLVIHSLSWFFYRYYQNTDHRWVVQRQPGFLEPGSSGSAGGSSNAGSAGGGEDGLREAFAGLLEALRQRPHMRAIILCPITQLSQVGSGA